jgi:hypothetical protein
LPVARLEGLLGQEGKEEGAKEKKEEEKEGRKDNVDLANQIIKSFEFQIDKSEICTSNYSTILIVLIRFPFF